MAFFLRNCLTSSHRVREMLKHWYSLDHDGDADDEYVRRSGDPHEECVDEQVTGLGYGFILIYERHHISPRPLRNFDLKQ